MFKLIKFVTYIFDNSLYVISLEEKRVTTSRHAGADFVSSHLLSLRSLWPQITFPSDHSCRILKTDFTGSLLIFDG